MLSPLGHAVVLLQAVAVAVFVVLEARGMRAGGNREALNA
jgi:hypothetical protein